MTTQTRNPQSVIRNLSSPAVLVGGLLLLLFVVVAAMSSGEAQLPPYHLESEQSNGLSILRTWLGEMGYQVGETSRTDFHLPAEDAQLLFVYPGQQSFSNDEVQQLRDMASTGMAVAIIWGGSENQDKALRETFQITPTSYFGGNEAAQQQPLLPDNPALVDDLFYAELLEIDETDGIVPVIVSDEGTATLAIKKVGAGVIWHLSNYHDLTNGQLDQPDRAKILLALLRTVPDGGRVVFDTYHLYGSIFGSDQRPITSVMDWLYYTPIGNAVIFAMVTLGAFCLLQGRRLGPPLPSAVELRRREAAEYVEAMANLYRRGQVATDVGAYQKRRFKLALGRSLHLSADLNDTDFLHTLCANDLRIDENRNQQIAQLFSELDSGNDEHVMRSSARIDDFMKEL